MAIQIGARPDSGFDDPIGMLTDCHRRIERFLSILSEVVERAEGRTLSGEETSAVQAALRYFRDGGERHTRDEEDSLFPRLRALDAGAIAAMEKLEDEHEQAAGLHRTVDRLYSAWIASGTLSPEDRTILLSATASLRGLYAEHIRVEEAVVFPRAARLLDRDSVAAIGSEFRARRL